ncbi:hypothetical protein JOQ06_021512 [Pogonophryne albipinna]|uniref:Uncharacterized protein n=1 Tax=Pogonophryne albipinna TaxID=1090488 RepID=A0AAD6F627_9TELE|nr:hypothetical protein JOQ06_021512 [Pogonophryne albipinna]
MAEDLTQQLRKDIEDCECFSLQLDESTDVSDTAQLCVFIRMVFTDMTAKEELLTILPMKEHTRGEDIFRTFKNFVDKTKLPMSKLSSITTDGAPAMVGRCNGFIAKCREDDTFPDFLNYHCIIHQHALCAKMLNMKEVMDVSLKVACSIRARPLQRRLFRAYLEDADCVHTDLLLHTDVRWLSRGNFLERFRVLLPEIKAFLHGTKLAEYARLDDEEWLLDLAFLTDITHMLNELNLELQGKDRTVVDMISSVNAFKRRLHLLCSKLQRKDLANFQNIASELEKQGKDSALLDNMRYTEQVNNITSDFEKRFRDFALLEPIATFMCYPFSEDHDIDSLAQNIGAVFHLNPSALEDEMLSLQADIQLKARAHAGQLWNLFRVEKYPNSEVSQRSEASDLRTEELQHVVAQVQRLQTRQAADRWGSKTTEW